MTYQEMKVLASHADAVVKMADALWCNTKSLSVRDKDICADRALETFLAMRPDSPLKAMAGTPEWTLKQNG